MAKTEREKERTQRANDKWAKADALKSFANLCGSFVLVPLSNCYKSNASEYQFCLRRKMRQRIRAVSRIVARISDNHDSKRTKRVSEDEARRD